MWVQCLGGTNPLEAHNLHTDVNWFLIYSPRCAFLQCEWLLGDRKPSPEDLDKGIDTNSPLFQAILENPVVQLGLTNPKTLLGIV